MQVVVSRGEPVGADLGPRGERGRLGLALGRGPPLVAVVGDEEYRRDAQRREAAGGAMLPERSQDLQMPVPGQARLDGAVGALAEAVLVGDEGLGREARV